MNPVIKLLITDIDHTLFSPECGIPQANIDALIVLQKSGVKVAVATGRVYPGVKAIVQQLKLDVYGGYAITSNGGLTTDCVTNTVVHEALIPVNELKAMVQLATELDLNLAVMQNEVVLYQGPDDSVAYDRDVVSVSVKAELNLVNQLHQDAHKLEVKQAPYRDGLAIDQFIRKLKNRYSVVRGHSTFMEVMVKGISKASGLDAICALHGYSKAETAVIGDGINDLEILAVAGISAAPINARPQVKAIVDQIVPHVNDAGVARFVDYILQENQRHR